MEPAGPSGVNQSVEGNRREAADLRLPGLPRADGHGTSARRRAFQRGELGYQGAGLPAVMAARAF